MKRITEDGEIVDVNCDDCVVMQIPNIGIFFKTPFNHDTNKESDRTGLKCEDTSLADQSFKEEVDINNIMDKVKAGAQLPVTLPEHFGDAFQIPTLLEARTRIAENNATFYKLAPELRAEFLNDPSRWETSVAAAVANNDLDELERYGIDMSEVRQRIEDIKSNAQKAQDSQDEKQLTELQNRLAKRAAAAPGGTSSPGTPKGQGDVSASPGSPKD